VFSKGMSVILGKRQEVTTHDNRCTKGLDIQLISGEYPWYSAVGFGRNMAAVFGNFSRFLLFDHRTDIWLILS